jgi:dihydroorotase
VLHNTGEPPGIPGQAADPNTKVNPPLRPAEDTRGLLEALNAGVFDIVATDHAPHATPEKQGSDFEHAAMGMSGLELALPTMLALVRAGHLTLSDLVSRMSLVPATLLRAPSGRLSPGAPADIVIFDQDQTWRVTPESLRTKSANTPLLGMEMRGRVVQTLVAGEMRLNA